MKNLYLDRLYKNSYDVIDKIQKPLEYLENLEHDELQMHTMISKIKDRDKLRGDNILKYFPEWTHILRMNIMEVLHRMTLKLQIDVMQVAHYVLEQALSSWCFRGCT